MQNSEIQKYLDFLLSAAIRKCGDISEAEDLVQETILAALTYESCGGQIDNMKSWLLTVMNRRFYDSLRRKYNLATVSVGEDFDIADEKDFVSDIVCIDEAEQVRREVAYLAETYRTIIVKHYFYGKTVLDISDELDIPVGTVKSRLDFGRKQLKKGFEKMENYTENSYMPKKMILRNSGVCGINEEPMSLVHDDDILEQNLLLLAYEKPVTVSELSKAIGVSAAYVEPIVRKLVDGELMKKTGNGRVYTDFIIYDVDDSGKYAKEAEKFAEENFDAYGEPAKKAIEKLKQTDFYSKRLERYLLIGIAECSVFACQNRHGKPQVFPDRPNGGRWIAFGSVVDDEYRVPFDKQTKEVYRLSGERFHSVDKYLDSSGLSICNYETNLYPFDKYEGFAQSFRTYLECEQNLLKLLYLIKKGIAPESVDCDVRMLKAMPFLETQGFIAMENGKAKVLVPCLTCEQHKTYRTIVNEAVNETVENLDKPMYEYLKVHKKKIPSHLDSVPEQKLTMPYAPHPMMFVCEAVRRGLHPRDLGYPCPETFIVFDK